MRINPDKLKRLAEQNGATPESLANALPKGDRRKQGEVALRKVRNWMSGRNHPSVKAPEIAAIAAVLGVEPAAITRFVSTYRFARSSSRKVGLLTQLIRGRRVDEALDLLRFSPKRAAVMVKKTLTAAIKDAEQNDAAIERLFVAESRVHGAVTIKRFQPKDRGRAHPIRKRTSHIVIGVEEKA
ncbi:MAG: 50S ribosomal protein L22 [Phycisphaerales bacterium]|nr:50S ribosomal protein L22 [Phycisphaerales bacterium]